MSLINYQSRRSLSAKWTLRSSVRAVICGTMVIAVVWAGIEISGILLAILLFLTKLAVPTALCAGGYFGWREYKKRVP